MSFGGWTHSNKCLKHCNTKAVMSIHIMQIYRTSFTFAIFLLFHFVKQICILDISFSMIITIRWCGMYPKKDRTSPTIL